MHNLLISASPLLNKIIKLIMKQKKVVNKLRATLSTQISFQLLIMLMLKNLKYFSLSCISTHMHTHTHLRTTYTYYYPHFHATRSNYASLFSNEFVRWGKIKNKKSKGIKRKTQKHKNYDKLCGNIELCDRLSVSRAQRSVSPGLRMQVKTLEHHALDHLQ